MTDAEIEAICLWFATLVVGLLPLGIRGLVWVASRHDAEWTPEILIAVQANCGFCLVTSVMRAHHHDHGSRPLPGLILLALIVFLILIAAAVFFGQLSAGTGTHVTIPLASALLLGSCFPAAYLDYLLAEPADAEASPRFRDRMARQGG
jgi:hypothetical protein